MSIDGIKWELPHFHDDDKAALDFLIKHGIDWKQPFADSNHLTTFLAFVGASFVENKRDVLNVKRYIYEAVKERLIEKFPNESEAWWLREAILLSPAVIAKIETREACNHIDEILDVADGAMVARGDLAKSIGPESVPAVQKQLINLCNLRGKPVITATEMLASMVEHPSPTRAEANDVFNAILDGTDAVMLSGETSSGAYPYQAVNIMTKIAEAAEFEFENFGKKRKLEESERRSFNEQRYQRLLVGAGKLYNEVDRRLSKGFKKAALGEDAWLTELYRQKLEKNEHQRITDRISDSACLLANCDSQYKAILAPSATGRTVRMLSRFRPGVKLIGAAHDCINRRKMIISYGVCSMNCGRKSTETGRKFAGAGDLFEECSKIAVKERYVRKGDYVIYTAGTPLFKPGTTNFIQIRSVK